MMCPIDRSECAREGCPRRLWIQLDDWQGCALHLADLALTELKDDAVKVARTIDAVVPGEMRVRLLNSAASALKKWLKS